MCVVLQSVFCGTKMSALGASVSGPRRVFCLNVIVQVGGLGDQLAHCALPLPAPQSNHHRPDGSFNICDVRLLSDGRTSFAADELDCGSCQPVLRKGDG